MRKIIDWIGGIIIFVLFFPMCMMSQVWDRRNDPLFWMVGLGLTVGYYVFVIWLIAALRILL